MTIQGIDVQHVKKVFLSRCPDPVLITTHLRTHTDYDSIIEPTSIICNTCYKSHQIIVSARTSQSTDSAQWAAWAGTNWNQRHWIRWGSRALTSICGPGAESENLAKLAEDVEYLTRLAYPEAAPESLAKHQLIDSLLEEDTELKIRQVSVGCSWTSFWTRNISAG